MKLEKYEVRGFDMWGNPACETVTVPRYNIFERIWRWLTRRRPRRITSIKIDGGDF